MHEAELVEQQISFKCAFEKILVMEGSIWRSELRKNASLGVKNPKNTSSKTALRACITRAELTDASVSFCAVLLVVWRNPVQCPQKNTGGQGKRLQVSAFPSRVHSTSTRRAKIKTLVEAKKAKENGLKCGGEKKRG